ncbi:MAG: hypothetical protein HZA52_12210 [Planctomycetes bacterium]|nr:hypothetical protein [Planctomycetota bacterium]
MNTTFHPELKAFVTRDGPRVRVIGHRQWLRPSKETAPRLAAESYLRDVADTLGVPSARFAHAHAAVEHRTPRKQPLEYRFGGAKGFFDSTTFAYWQTIHNTPIWKAGMTVTVKLAPSRIVSLVDHSHAAVDAELPDAKAIRVYQQLFDLADDGKLAGSADAKDDAPKPTAASERLSALLGLDRLEILRDSKKGARRAPTAVLRRGRFYFYAYRADERISDRHGHDDARPKHDESAGVRLTLPLPAVAKSIREGEYRLVAELIFTLTQAGIHSLNWRALVDVETGSVLYLRPLIDNVNALVFVQDPITSTGNTALTKDQPDAVLDPERDDVTLTDLDAPNSGIQELSGTHVRVIDDDAPAIAAPTAPSGTDFDFHTRTNDFAAVSAYFHANNFFRTVESLGFPLSTYFDGTSFPVHVDHRASFGDAAGVELNAFCGGDNQGDGIGLVGYCLGDLSDTANPLGRAVDNWVHWHEIGGHGILWDHVDSPNLGFAHSAGDGLAAIQNDPTSQLRTTPDRFEYAPFRDLGRRFDRDVTAGWAFGGVNDNGGYGTEEILATAHFRLYRSIGGDSSNLARRQFASRMATYLILNAVGKLMPGTNPDAAEEFCDQLIAADLDNWVSEGLYGGAYNKVIRWAFEKQGAFQPSGAPTPVTSAGAPPAVDVYVEDGRAGEYPFQAVHWHNTSMWNRTSDDGLVGHQEPILGQLNYAYVKIKNRGTQAATNITVRGFHTLPGAGLLWPSDFEEFAPAGGIPVASLAANSAEELLVGPFAWTPNINAYGHDCMLMIASCAQDPSNVDHFTTGESIAEWRLVPNDNNIGQRNVHPVPGGGGERGLRTAVHERVLFVRNPHRGSAHIKFQIGMPGFLDKRRWACALRGVGREGLVLGAGERRELKLELVAGADFTADDVVASPERDLTVQVFADDILIGGMTYRIDPELKSAANSGSSDPSAKCRDTAQDLLRCLSIDAGKIERVCVKKVSIDIDLDPHCQRGCDD